MDKDQHSLFEEAQRRIHKKKRCYSHTVLFLIGSVFVFLTNKVLHYGPETDWYVWIILFWGMLLTYHYVHVFLMHPFLGIQWERKQREKLIQIQRERIREIEAEMENSRDKREPNNEPQ